ncbi:transposase [Draconibacterium sp.]|uniref:transposase n=1 Tax=Draconibacterium sp. TaxID=1965318 RepID=UPI00356191E9
MTEKRKESAEYIAMRDLALSQLRSGKSLTGEGGVFAPIIKEFLESALSAEMESHLDDAERGQGNKRNGKSSKTLKTSTGEVTIETPQDRHSTFNPQIVKKRETILADNLAPKIIGLYGWKNRSK